MEVRPGIFLGSPSQRVRDELWKRVTAGPDIGYVAQLWSSPTPQGFACRQYGTSKRQFIDREGVYLITRATRARRKRH
jgi:CRISPR-associated protein Cas2